MSKIPQTPEELKQHLDEQIQFLVTSADAYDKGVISEAKRIATSIRVLMHDTGSSKSLLGQLGLKTKKFYDTASQADRFFSEGIRLGSFSGLVAITIGEKGQYVPLFDQAPPGTAEYVDFDTYWKRVIFIDNKKNTFTRKDIVCTVANQDGGAHVDVAINADYHELSRRNSMGLKVSGNGSEPVAPSRSDLPALRQIAHEVLRSMVTDYPRKKMETNGLPAMPCGIVIVKDGDEFSKKIKEWTKVGIYDQCPCKSGKKYKWCCGRKAN